MFFSLNWQSIEHELSKDPFYRIQAFLQATMDIDRQKYAEEQRSIVIRAINAARILSKHQHRGSNWDVCYTRESSLTIPDLGVEDEAIAKVAEGLAWAIVDFGMDVKITLQPTGAIGGLCLPILLEEAEMIAEILEGKKNLSQNP